MGALQKTMVKVSATVFLFVACLSVLITFSGKLYHTSAKVFFSSLLGNMAAFVFPKECKKIFVFCRYSHFYKSLGLTLCGGHAMKFIQAFLIDVSVLS